MKWQHLTYNRIADMLHSYHLEGFAQHGLASPGAIYSCLEELEQKSIDHLRAMSHCTYLTEGTGKILAEPQIHTPAGTCYLRLKSHKQPVAPLSHIMHHQTAREPVFRLPTTDQMNLPYRVPYRCYSVLDHIHDTHSQTEAITPWFSFQSLNVIYDLPSFVLCRPPKILQPHCIYLRIHEPALLQAKF